MAFHLIASHIQQEHESELAHDRLVAIAREGRGSGHSPLARARAAIGLRIVGLGLALGGDDTRRRTRDAVRTRTVAA